MISKIQLPNGMKVLFVPTHKSPVISVQAWVNTGSADEQKGEEGISHFIEHLLFKGTENFGVGEIASIVEGSGGELNAYTSFDQTVFYVTISKQFVDIALNTISDMVGFPKFDSSEIDNEREVVIEEIKRSFDSAPRQASRQLFSTIYEKHPYRLPVLGFEENIREVSRDTLVNYYNSRYVPQNMTLVVTGDFQKEELKPKIKEKFGRLKSFKLRNVKRPSEPRQEIKRISVKPSDFEEAHLNIAWKTPNILHKDIPALEVLALIFGQGESSRLFQRLRVKESAANGVGAGVYSPKDDGFFYISSHFNPKSLQRNMELIGDEILWLLKDPPSSDELQKAKVLIESEDFYSLETVDGLARKYGTYETQFGDPKYHEKFVNQIQKLTTQDVHRVAKKYLKPNLINVCYLRGKDDKSDKKTFETWIHELEDFSNALSKVGEVQKPKKEVKIKKFRFISKEEKHDVQKIQLKNGVKLFVLPTRQTPTISMKMGFLGGQKSEKPEEMGISEVFSRALTGGSANYSEYEIQDTMDNKASSLRGFSGRNTVGLSLTTLSPFLDKTLDIALDTITSATFPNEVVQREVRVLNEARRSRNDNPAQLAIRKFTENIFKGHPYEKDLLGTEESLSRLDSQRVSTYSRALLSSKNAHISIVGDVDVDKMTKKIEPILERLSSQEVPFGKVECEDRYEDYSDFLSIDKAQSHILLGYKGLTIDNDEKYALQIVEAILSGQGGRLFLELRDKSSLAYSVSPINLTGFDAGFFATYIGCSPEKGKLAIEMMRAELDKLKSTNISQNELERAKRYIIGRHDIDLQRNSSINSAILFNEIYGVSYREIFDYPDKIGVITAKDIRTVAEKVFSQCETLVCVGSEKPW